jgi:hypothetical protein
MRQATIDETVSIALDGSVNIMESTIVFSLSK